MGRSSKDYHYATDRAILFDKHSRFEKAEKIFWVLNEKYSQPLKDAVVLDIGCSAGLIDIWLANKVHYIYGIDIDEDIVPSVKEIERNVKNFKFVYAGGAKLPFKDQTLDIIIANAMYYLLLPEAQQEMFTEIRRCLKPQGICYFSAPNRLLLIDGKYNLPFLVWTPVWLGRIYVKLFSRIKEYNEYYKTLFGLRKMVKMHFAYEDITLEIIDHADRYKFLSNKNRFIKLLVRVFARIFYIFLPNYIFILHKQGKTTIA